MTRLKQVAMIGECMIELNGEPFGELHQTFGGDTLNTAIYTARAMLKLGHKSNVSYVTALGTDPVSAKMQELWREEHIDTSLVASFENKTPGLYWIILDKTGERSFMYWRDQAAAKIWLAHPKSSQVLATIDNYAWIYLSGISLAILNDEDRAKLLSFLKEYRKKGGKIAFDSNYRKALWQDSQEMRRIYSAILSITDLALLTNEDEMAIWDIQESEILENLEKFSLPILVLKQGADGAKIIENSELKSSRVIKSIKVATIVDTTAAGDSFNAGVLVGLMQNLSIDKACKMGHAIASTVIQYKGAVIPKDKMPILNDI